MERKIYSLELCVGLLVSMYIAGIVGLSIEFSRPFFEKLVVFHLLLSSAVLFYFHPKFDLKFLLISTIVIFSGYFIEVAGVATGRIFGSYQYGETLGFKLLNVPVLIGLNWLILVYSASSFFNQLKTSVYIKILMGAMSLVILDAFIEPVAIRYSFWSWQGPVPIQNYIAWFLIAVCLLSLVYFSNYVSNNKLVKFFYPMQFLFFIMLYLVN